MTDYLLVRFASTELWLPKPWPVVVKIDGTSFPEIVSGRPDAGRLVGFGSTAHPTTVTLPGWDLPTERPTDAIGLCPSYVAVDGSGIFALPTTVVTSIEPYEADEAAIEALHAREIEYRLALVRNAS